MRTIRVALLALLCLAVRLSAQVSTVVATADSICGLPTLTLHSPYLVPLHITQQGQLCIAGTFSATVSSIQTLDTLYHIRDTVTTHSNVYTPAGDTLAIKCLSGCSGGGGSGDSVNLDTLKVLKLAWQLDSLLRLDSATALGRVDTLYGIRDSINVSANIKNMPSVTIGSPLLNSKVSVADSIWFVPVTTAGRLDSISRINHVTDSVAFALPAGSNKIGNVGDSVYYPLQNGRVKVADSLTSAPTLTVSASGDTGISNYCKLSALNAVCEIATNGRPYIGVEIDSAHDVGLMHLTVEQNSDSGTGSVAHWVQTIFWNGDAWVGSDSVTSPDSAYDNGYARTFSIPPNPVVNYWRVRVSSYTSGFIFIRIKSTPVAPSNQLLVCASIDRIAESGAGVGNIVGNGSNTATVIPCTVGGIMDSLGAGFAFRVADNPPTLTSMAIINRPLNQSRFSGTTGTSLGAANANVQVSVEGYNSASAYIGASTLSGTVQFQVSDGVGSDTSWSTTTAINGVTNYSGGVGVVNPVANSGDYALLLPGGARLARAIVTSYTSGSVVIKMLATNVNNFPDFAPFTGAVGANLPILSAQVMFGDTAATRIGIVPTVRKNSTPVTTDNALVVSLTPQSAGVPFPSSTDSVVTGVGANVADSATVPAKSGLRAIVTAICWTISDSTTTVAAAAPDTMTTTGLVGTPKWFSGNVVAAGGQVLPFGTACITDARGWIATAQNTAVKFRVNATGAHSVNNIVIHYYFTNAF